MTLFDYIKKNESVRTLFGKREIVIIQKQLLGLKLTQSERNRLSRNIRVKFKVIKELSAFSFDFELNHGGEIKKIINETKEIILQSKYRKNIKKIEIFGSTVDKTRTLSSDIDVCVEFKNIDKNTATLFRLDMMKKLPAIVDIQVYNILPEKIKKEIDYGGKIIFNE